MSPVTFEGTRSVCELSIELHSDSDRRSEMTWRNSSGELAGNCKSWSFGFGVDAGILPEIEIKIVRLSLFANCHRQLEWEGM